ncbi:MAG: hypothetical protein BEN19_06710 [Epulopiscium sp. Nuni2H_MBin003]|nr:MAG: hypothetical protein BEN19_06710 [Epulopiscium sp. Nuni2H_MBin003]
MIVLKVIAIILLVLIILILCCLSLILFLPNKYDIYVENYGVLFVEADIDILSIVKIKYDGKLSIYIFGKQLKKRKKLSPKKSKKSIEKDMPIDKDTSINKDMPINKDIPIDKEMSIDKENKTRPMSNTETPKNIDSNIKTDNKKVDNKKDMQEQADISENKTSYKSIVSTMINSEYRNDAIAKAIHCLKQIIQIIKPKQLEFNLEIGADSPDKTGDIMAILGIFCPVYVQHGYISANYIEQGIWGNVNAIGKFNLYQLFKIIMKLILYKPFRIFVKQVIDSKDKELNRNEEKIR